jgi:hypothetical protein
VPVPVIVNKTCSGVMRRPPEGASPNPTDHTPNYQADRPGEQQARPSTENSTDVVRARTRWRKSKGNHQSRRCSQQSLPHGSSPVRLNVKSNIRAPSAQRGKWIGDLFQWIVAGEPHVTRPWDGRTTSRRGLKAGDHTTLGHEQLLEIIERRPQLLEDNGANSAPQSTKHDRAPRPAALVVDERG